MRSSTPSRPITIWFRGLSDYSLRMEVTWKSFTRLPRRSRAALKQNAARLSQPWPRKRWFQRAGIRDNGLGKRWARKVRPAPDGLRKFPGAKYWQADGKNRSARLVRSGLNCTAVSCDNAARDGQTQARPTSGTGGVRTVKASKD